MARHRGRCLPARLCPYRMFRSAAGRTSWAACSAFSIKPAKMEPPQSQGRMHKMFGELGPPHANTRASPNPRGQRSTARQVFQFTLTALPLPCPSLLRHRHQHDRSRTKQSQTGYLLLLSLVILGQSCCHFAYVLRLTDPPFVNPGKGNLGPYRWSSAVGSLGMVGPTLVSQYTHSALDLLGREPLLTRVPAMSSRNYIVGRLS